MRLVAKNELPVAPFDMKVMAVTRKTIEGWAKPDFQRPVAENKNLGELAVQIQDQGWLLTAIYLGIWMGKTYLVDGQHRMQAFIASGLEQMSVPVITKYYLDGAKGLAAMCEDFLRINSHIKNPTANDMLKALEGKNSHIKEIRTNCPFVGYTHLRRTESAPILGMAQAIRALVVSRQEIPGSWMGKSAASHGAELVEVDVRLLTSFLKLAFQAWGRGRENRYLWGPLNLALCLWFFRRMVKGFTAEKAALTQAKFLDGFFSLHQQALPRTASRQQRWTDERSRDTKSRLPRADEDLQAEAEGRRRPGLLHAQARLVGTLESEGKEHHAFPYPANPGIRYMIKPKEN